jgi:low temperature requirement protein LtrA
MTDAKNRRIPRARVADEGHRVTTFELLFDLVFVFAFTQETQFMAHAHSALGVLQAMIILGLLWWSWASYSWLANQTHVDEGVVRGGMTIAMGAMFVVALTIPEAFHDLEGGLYGPIVFVAAYALVRFVHIGLYLIAADGDVALRRQVLKTSTAMLASVAVLVVGALIGGPLQTWFWLGGIVVDIVLTYLTSSEGSWHIQSAAHWAERYGLVVILALGESVVAIGVGAAHEEVSLPILGGAVLAITLTASLWWLYFDVIAIAAEHHLAEQKGVRRAAMATDAYTYLHLPLIAGIVISALGVEDVIAHAAGDEPLGMFGAYALFGGPSLYLAAHAFFWKRVGGRFKVLRLVGGTLLLALIPLGAALHPLASLAITVAVVAGVAVAETQRYAEKRAQVRETRT